MKKLIIEILKKWACRHNWDKYYETQTYDSPNREMPIRRTHTLICSECGKIKKINV